MSMTFVNLVTPKGGVEHEFLSKGSCTQVIWVGDFVERCDFKIEKSVSNCNRQRQVFIVFTPV
jgi:hypothetical protein